MYKINLKIKLSILKVLLLFIIASLLPKTFIYASDSEPYNILLLNSYHQGYTWSDDIFSGISAVFESTSHPYNIDIEYMDSKRYTTDDYFSILNTVYSTKYEDSNYDVIIANDDSAYSFLKKYGESIFGLKPIVICGLNYFDESEIEDYTNFTGVVEAYDISDTIAIALEQNPKIKTIYYINDDTITGKNIKKEFQPVIDKFSTKIKFERIDGENYNSILEQTKNLSSDSIVLFLIYFKDRENTYYEYDQAISMLYDTCNRPIYGVWDFHLGYGILGGKLVSGYNQGELAASQALKILNGSDIKELDFISENTTSYAFDYNILKKYNIHLDNIPKQSKLINYEGNDSLQILLLHSYNRNLQWTEDMERGIRDNIVWNNGNITYSIDYMDIKQHPHKKYQMQLYDFLSKKYNFNSFDLVITTDDAAFNFITTYSNFLSKDIPIFFCGVNNKIDYESIDKNRITGLIENNDYKSTIEVMKNFHPNMDEIVVINDETITGKANRINLEEIISLFDDELDFTFWDELNMPDLLSKSEKIPDTSSILLLSFTQDRSFNNFTYNESLRMIGENTDAPIYGLWDFYLGNGIVGGSLKSGYSQGAKLGKMVSSYLDGTLIKDIPIQTSGLDEYQFDYEQLTKYNIPLKKVPQEAKIINKPFSIINFIKNNYIYISGVILLLIIIILLVLNIKLSKKMLKKEQYYARRDKLTGIFNRRACFEILEEQLNYCKEKNTNLTIGFIDLNNLKLVNDKFGHEYGDIFIKCISDLFVKNIREFDSVGRFGGDEFLLILPKTNINQAQKIIKRVNEQLKILNNSKEYPFILSFSFGFASFNQKTCNDVLSLISTADKQMYENKMYHRSKNRTFDNK